LGEDAPRTGRATYINEKLIKRREA